MHKNKNTLIITSEFPPLPGGIGNHAFNLAENLQNKGFHVQVITDQRTLDNHKEIDFDTSQDFKVTRAPIYRYRLKTYLFRISRLLTLISKNETIIASGKFSLWIVAFASLFFWRKKYIAIIHGTEVNYQPFLLKKSIDLSLKRFQKVIAVSNYTKQLVKHLELKNISVIPNGYYVEETTSTPKKAKKNNTLSLLTIGNVTERKGQHNVISHLPKLLEFYPNAEYHCVGIPSEMNAFQKLAKNLNVTDHVFFHGKVSEEEKIEFITNSDIFVMLSENTASGDVEGFGIAILEANHYGVPAIGSKNCGIEDAIFNKKSGLLIDRKSSEDFLGACKDIVSNKNSYSENASKWARNFTWDKIIKHYIETIYS